MSNPARDMLHKFQVSDLVDANRKLISAKSTDSVWTVVKMLADHKIQSVPVFSENGGFEGFVDVGDITNFVVACAPEPNDLQNHPVESLSMAGRAISLVPISRVMGMFTKQSLPIFAHDPATHAADVFQSTTHHIVVFDESKKAVNVCSQSDLVRFLDKHLPDALKGIPLTKYGFGVCDVFSISETAPVLAAMQKLALTQVSALAVVDSNGVLKGNFSASDLRGLYTTPLPGFNQPIGEYLKTLHPKSLSPITADPSQDLHANIHNLVANKVHHAWTVDAEGRPVGLVSMTDLVKLVMNWVPQ